ncbi:MAG: TonB family protein [Lysobacter sp.]
MKGSLRLKGFLSSALIFFSGTVCAAAPVIEVPVQATCEEHITSEPRLTINDWPEKARGRDVSGYVVISYSLDGSGSAKELTVTDSKPKRLFDKATLKILERTEFAKGIQSSSCVYVRTYGAVKRADR